MSGLVYFAASAENSASQIELWETDGTVAGTVEVVNAPPILTRAIAFQNCASNFKR